MGYLIPTIAQKNALIGKPFKASTNYNPIEDSLGRWLLTESQVDECTNEEFMFVKLFAKVEFEKKIIVIPIQ